MTERSRRRDRGTGGASGRAAARLAWRYASLRFGRLGGACLTGGSRCRSASGPQTACSSATWSASREKRSARSISTTRGLPAWTTEARRTSFIASWTPCPASGTGFTSRTGAVGGRGIGGVPRSHGASRRYRRRGGEAGLRHVPREGDEENIPGALCCCRNAQRAGTGLGAEKSAEPGARTPPRPPSVAVSTIRSPGPCAS